MSLVSRISNQLHSNATSSTDQTHLGLRHKHTAAIFQKGTMSILTMGRNYKYCVLRKFKKRKRKIKERRTNRQKRLGQPDSSRRMCGYRQLPIIGWKKNWTFKTMHISDSSTLRHRRVKNVKTMQKLRSRYPQDRY